MVAKDRKYWGDGGKSLNKAHKTFALFIVIKFIETMDEVAQEKDVIWLLLFGPVCDFFEHDVFNFGAKMKIAQKDKIKGRFAVLIERITGLINRLHLLNYTIIPLMVKCETD